MNTFFKTSIFFSLLLLLLSCSGDNNEGDTSFSPYSYEGFSDIQIRYQPEDRISTNRYTVEAAIYDESGNKVFSKIWQPSVFSSILKESKEQLLPLENAPAGQYQNIVLLGRDYAGVSIRGEAEASISPDLPNQTIDISVSFFSTILNSPVNDSSSTRETLPDFEWEAIDGIENYLITISPAAYGQTGNTIIQETVGTNSFSSQAFINAIDRQSIRPLSQETFTNAPDTGQILNYDNEKKVYSYQIDEAFFGEDADYQKYPASFSMIEYIGEQHIVVDQSPVEYRWNVSPIDQYGNVGAPAKKAFTFSIFGPVVRDNNTGLFWTIKTVNDNSIHDTEKNVAWDEIPTLLGEMNHNKYGGFDDWRLPTVQELSTVYLCESRRNRSLDSIRKYLPNTSLAEYWTSTQLAHYSTQFEPVISMWLVDFNIGEVYARNLSTEPARVRFVRGESIPSRYTDNGDGTITDSGSGLNWSKPVAGPMTWKEALQYCEGLAFSGHDDWKLPNRNELISLIDYSRRSPNDVAAIDPLFVDETYASNVDLLKTYWTSTTDIDEPRNAYTADFSEGEVRSNNKVFTSGIMVRPVRYVQ